MNIGILGAGNIGGNLGRRLAAEGHQVRFGVRSVDKVKALLEECPGSSAGDLPSAARFGELVVLAVPWAAVPETLDAAGDLTGKILIDTSNAVRWNEGPEPAIAEGSAAQQIAARCPTAQVVKAFNTLGAEHILDPSVGGQPADVFVCGDDSAARQKVQQLAAELGFHPVDLGPLRNARLVEHLAITWIYLATKGGLGRDIAFKLLRG